MNLNELIKKVDVKKSQICNKCPRVSWSEHKSLKDRHHEVFAAHAKLAERFKALSKTIEETKLSVEYYKRRAMDLQREIDFLKNRTVQIHGASAWENISNTVDKPRSLSKKEFKTAYRKRD